MGFNVGARLVYQFPALLSSIRAQLVMTDEIPSISMDCSILCLAWNVEIESALRGFVRQAE